VVSRDDLPLVQNITYPSAYIINTDKSNEPGSHWLAIYYTNTRECYFFDSIGMGPRFYDLTGFLKPSEFSFSSSPIVFMFTPAMPVVHQCRQR
jgi:hypothetical protein